MYSTITGQVRGYPPDGGAYRTPYDDQPTAAHSGRPTPTIRSSKLTKVAALAVLAAVAALGAEGAWLLSHHDATPYAPAPVAHAVPSASAPIVSAGGPAVPATIGRANDVAATGLSPANSDPVYAPAVSASATSTPGDLSDPSAPAALDPAAPVQPAPVINVVLPPLPPADNGTASGQNGQTGGQNGGGTGGQNGTGTGSASGGAGTKTSGIDTSHLNDQEEVRGTTASGSPAPGSTGTFGNTTANPGGSSGSGNGQAPGATMFPSAAQRLFP